MMYTDSSVTELEQPSLQTPDFFETVIQREPSFIEVADRKNVMHIPIPTEDREASQKETERSEFSADCHYMFQMTQLELKGIARQLEIISTTSPGPSAVGSNPTIYSYTPHL